MSNVETNLLKQLLSIVTLHYFMANFLVYNTHKRRKRKRRGRRRRRLVDSRKTKEKENSLTNDDAFLQKAMDLLTQNFSEKLHIRDTEEYDDDDNVEDEEADAAANEDIAIEEDTEEEKKVSTTDTSEKDEVLKQQLEHKVETKGGNVTEQLDKPDAVAPSKNVTHKDADSSSRKGGENLSVIVILVGINTVLAF